MATVLTRFACVFLLVFAPVLNAKEFRCDYRYFRDTQGWLKLHRVPANWFEARLRCHLEGGKLASPLNPSLQNAMKTLIGNASGDMSGGVFTGISGFFSKGDYHSIEGVPLWKVPHTWAPDEPDNCKDQENCIAMLADGNFADVDCHNPLPYLCYQKNTNRTVINSCGTTDNEYEFDQGTSTCYKFHTVPRTWSRAYMTCAAEGAHLIIINSEGEAQVVRNLFAKHPAASIVGNFYKDFAFVGFQDWNEHGEWLTIHEKSLAKEGYAKFSAGEPNNGTGEFCGGVFRTGLLADVLCEEKYTFICEKIPDSLLCDP